MITEQQINQTEELAKFTSQVYKKMYQELSTSHQEIQPIIEHLLNRRGKFLRPTLVYFTANLNNDSISQPIEVATASEIIHLASLVHDDIIDNSDYRRGQESINHKWGTKSAVLIGDHLFSRAFSLLTNLSSTKVLKTYTDAISKMCQGELLQLSHCYHSTISEQKYLEIIDHKTASLIAASCKSGGLLTECSTDKLNELSQFGLHLGRAYQIIDDLKDITSVNLGNDKPAKKDICQGIVTLPFIYLIQDKPQVSKQLQYLWTNGFTDDSFNRLYNTLINSGKLHHCLHKARRELESAHRCLENISDYSCDLSNQNTSQAFLGLLIKKLENKLKNFHDELSNYPHFSKQFT